MNSKEIKLCINIEIDGKYHKIKLKDFQNPKKIASTFIKNKKLDENLIESLADNIQNFLIRAKNRKKNKKNFERKIEESQIEINEDIQNLSNLTKESDDDNERKFDFSDFESMENFGKKLKTENSDISKGGVKDFLKGRVKENLDFEKNLKIGNNENSKGGVKGILKGGPKDNLDYEKKMKIGKGKKSIFEKLYNKGKLKQQYLNEKSYELSKNDFCKRKKNKKICEIYKGGPKEISKGGVKEKSDFSKKKI